MRRTLFALFSSLVLAATAYPHASRADDTLLQCPGDEANSRAALKKAPSGARRHGKHQLVVHWQHGVLSFDDQSPHEPLSGTHYAYCDYSAAVHMHLISKQEDSLLTGVLLNDDNGQLLPGGHSVSFSPDLHLYFVRRQSDGMDGEEWAIYHQDGSPLWQGDSGLSDPARTNWSAILESPHWSSDNHLQAWLTCAAYIGSPRTHKTLVSLESKDGSYQWWPKVACPRQIR